MERRENVFAIAFRVLVERPSLAVMMFLQYAIWGAWSVALSGYLEQELGFGGQQLALDLQRAAADELDCALHGRSGRRSIYARAVRALALFHLLGGLLLFGLAFQRELLPMTALMLGLRFLLRADARALQLGRLPQPERPREWSSVPSACGAQSAGLWQNLLVNLRALELSAHCSGASSMCFALAGGISMLAALL
jgi:hypothetical protein